VIGKTKANHAGDPFASTAGIHAFRDAVICLPAQLAEDGIP